MGDIGDPRAVERLTQACNDSDLFVRIMAAEAIIKLGYPLQNEIMNALVGDLNTLGLLAFDASKPDEALIAFDKAIELDPQLAEAWNNKGNALDVQGKHDEAIKAYDEALRLDPNYVMAWTNKGVALAGQASTMKPSNVWMRAMKI